MREVLTNFIVSLFAIVVWEQRRHVMIKTGKVLLGVAGFLMFIGELLIDKGGTLLLSGYIV